jgi:hypothetical protein
LQFGAIDFIQKQFNLNAPVTTKIKEHPEGRSKTKYQKFHAPLPD